MYIAYKTELIKTGMDRDIKTMFEKHLYKLIVWLEKLQKELRQICIDSGFIYPKYTVWIYSSEEESLIELFYDSSLKTNFDSLNLIEF